MSIQATTGAVKAQVNSIAVSSAKKDKPIAEPGETIPKATQAKTLATVKDSVQISSAGQAAYEEATETAAQTAQEARKGDRQALRLQAKEVAAKEVPAELNKQNEIPAK